MADRPLELHTEAEEEYLHALAWYCERSLPAGIKFERAFRQAIEQIEKFPERWPAYFVRFRKYTLHQFPFSIVYRNEPSRTFVLAVVHGRRRPGYWKGRV
jgi:plasmid stabilization system protein ParE